ncbi:MAG TPA: hypothetical protein VGR76_09435 [Candidatus Angelobacter sp.]|jgi:hypothetical protein|nr:hypothetical protein [Candidatus Angelobacter sp.]
MGVFTNLIKRFSKNQNKTTESRSRTGGISAAMKNGLSADQIYSADVGSSPR